MIRGHSISFKDGTEIQVQKKIEGLGYCPCCMGLWEIWAAGDFLFVNAGDRLVCNNSVKRWNKSLSYAILAIRTKR